jgi:hypothetical protein
VPKPPPPPQPGDAAGLLVDSQPWPPVDALPGVAANRGPRSALPLLAIIARVSLAIAVREAEEEGPAHDGEAPAARSGDLQPSPQVPGVAAVGALLSAVCPPHQSYGPSGLDVVESP